MPYVKLAFFPRNVRFGARYHAPCTSVRSGDRTAVLCFRHQVHDSESLRPRGTGMRTRRGPGAAAIPASLHWAECCKAVADWVVAWG